MCQYKRLWYVSYISMYAKAQADLQSFAKAFAANADNASDSILDLYLSLICLHGYFKDALNFVKVLCNKYLC